MHDFTVNVARSRAGRRTSICYGSRLTVDGKSKRVKFVDLQIGVRSLGRRFTLQAGTNSPNNIYVMIGSDDYSWNSVAGTVSTAGAGTLVPLAGGTDGRRLSTRTNDDPGILVRLRGPVHQLTTPAAQVEGAAREARDQPDTL